MIALVFTSGSFAQNRQQRRAVWANRPNRAARINAYATGFRGQMATGDVQTLSQAYSTLASADHDYKGHRVKAMHAIKKAARLMGQTLGGNAKGQGKEQQTLSDAQLQGVKGMLQKVRGTVSGRTQGRVVAHIDTAIHELSTALSIK